MEDKQAELTVSCLRNIKQRNLKEAVRLCIELNTTYPKNFEGWRLAGILHKNFNKPKAGLVSTSKALELKPNNPEILIQRFHFLSQLQRIDEAKKIFYDRSNKAYKIALDKFKSEQEETEEETNDDFENLYKGQVSKSGVAILPSKRTRRIPEVKKPSLADEALSELKAEQPEIKEENLETEEAPLELSEEAPVEEENKPE